MAEATDAFWHFIKRETRDQFKPPGVFSLRRLDLRVNLVKEELAKDGRFAELLAKIPDFDRRKSGPWATFVKKYLAGIQGEFNQKRKKRSKAPHEAEENGAAVEAPLKEEAAALPTQLVVARPAAHPTARRAVKRPRDEAPLPAELKCIAECEVLVEIIRQKLSALPAESIKRALLSADMLALDLEGLKAAASAFPLSKRSAQPEEPPLDGVAEEEYDSDGLGFCPPPRPLEPSELSEEPPLGGVGEEEYDTDGLGQCPLPPAPEPSALSGEAWPFDGAGEEECGTDGLGFCTLPLAEPTPAQITCILDELLSTHGSGQEE
ncbi:hypothetical protein AB1Y20_012323 [Prymnesium parvum]|uniref:Uncharacterized protein n=1 Tax=Prymnesium parvum TaxID=97485 RepID=A0AB34IQX8_PRYPA